LIKTDASYFINKLIFQVKAYAFLFKLHSSQKHHSVNT